MKKPLLMTAAVLSSALCWAQDVGRVISSTPVVQQVGVPRQVCSTEQVAVQPPKSGAGAVVGALVGGVVGGAMSPGRGQAAAAVVGAVGGALVGDKLEGTPTAELRDVQRCGTQTVFENRTVGYNVVYEFGGKQYSVQMPQDPGPTIQLQVSPAGLSSAQPAAAQPVYVQPATVVVAPPVYRTYYPAPYYPPVSLEFGFWDGYRGRHWH